MKKNLKSFIFFCIFAFTFLVLTKNVTYAQGTCEVIPSTVNNGYDGTITIKFAEIKIGSANYSLHLPDNISTLSINAENNGEITFSLNQNGIKLTTSVVAELMETTPGIPPKRVILCTGQITVTGVTSTPIPTPTVSQKNCELTPASVSYGYKGVVSIQDSRIIIGQEYIIDFPDFSLPYAIEAVNPYEISVDLYNLTPLTKSGDVTLIHYHPPNSDEICSTHITVSTVTATPSPAPTPSVIPPPGICAFIPKQVEARYPGDLTIVGQEIKKETLYRVSFSLTDSPSSPTDKIMSGAEMYLTVTAQDRHGIAFMKTGTVTVRTGNFANIKVCEGTLIVYPAGTTPIPSAEPLDPTCYSKNGRGDQINTALGCIPLGNLNEFAAWLLSKLIFVASGIAFLLMVVGAIQILTSAGNPDKVKAGKELITSALSGLLFIILSIFLLKLIGVDILHIPGLGK